MSEGHQGLLSRVYEDFNARNIEAILAVLHPEVEWPNGWEGGWAHGRDAVRAYWTRQWAEIDSSVEPVAMRTDGHGRVHVTAHQVVRSLNGEVLTDEMVEHAYEFEGELVKRMEIVRV